MNLISDNPKITKINATPTIPIALYASFVRVSFCWYDTKIIISSPTKNINSNTFNSLNVRVELMLEIHKNAKCKKFVTINKNACANGDPCIKANIIENHQIYPNLNKL